MNVVIDECVRRLATNRPGHARRLFHGRGHTFPGLEHLVVSWYPPYLHVASYAAAAKIDVHGLHDALAGTGVEIAGVALQQRDGRRTTTTVPLGSVPDEHVTRESDLQFYVRPLHNQNTGLFMDMAHVRRELAGHVAERRVLNLFAYTCAFSVSALANGAALVVNNDMSRNALEWGKRNHALNDLDPRGARMLPHNLFKSWWKIRQLGPYDVIIIDPPTNQRGSFVAEKQYGQILKRIPDFASPGALVVACLNSPFLGSDFLETQMQRWCPAARFVEQLPPHPDFPERYPERGSKVLLYRYRP